MKTLTYNILMTTFMCSALIAFYVMLVGCASPTRDLYKSTSATCPNTCAPAAWNGKLEVTEDWIKCICEEK